MGGELADHATVKTSRYQRLGGAAGVAAVIDDAFDRHAANPALASQCHGLDLPELKAQGMNSLIVASGGPGRVLPAGPLPQHTGMAFSAAQLQAVVRDLAQALSEQGVGMAEVGEVVSLIRRLNRPPPPARCCTRPGTIQERGLHSLHTSRSDRGPVHRQGAR